MVREGIGRAMKRRSGGQTEAKFAKDVRKYARRNKCKWAEDDLLHLIKISLHSASPIKTSSLASLIREVRKCDQRAAQWAHEAVKGKPSPEMEREWLRRYR